jgi:hypothetical protein
MVLRMQLHGPTSVELDCVVYLAFVTLSRAVYGDRILMQARNSEMERQWFFRFTSSQGPCPFETRE